VYKKKVNIAVAAAIRMFVSWFATCIKRKWILR